MDDHADLFAFVCDEYFDGPIDLDDRYAVYRTWKIRQLWIVQGTWFDFLCDQRCRDWKLIDIF